MLPADELAALRADAEATLEDGAVVVLTRSLVSDGGGGMTETFTPQPAAPGRIAPLKLIPRDGRKGDRPDQRTSHYVTVPVGTLVATNDRVQIDGRTYEVLGVDAWDRTDMPLLRLDARLLP